MGSGRHLYKFEPAKHLKSQNIVRKHFTVRKLDNILYCSNAPINLILLTSFVVKHSQQFLAKNAIQMLHILYNGKLMVK